MISGFKRIAKSPRTGHEAAREHSRLAATLEAMADAYMLMDRNWRILQVNSQAEKAVGKSREEMLGKNKWDVFPEGEKFRSQYEHAFKTGEAVHFEEFYAPGKQWLSVDAYPTGSDLAVFFRDITERKQAEEHLRESDSFLRQVIEASPSMIFVKDRSGRFALVNGALARHYGTTSEDIIGKTDADFNANPTEVEHFLRYDRQVMDTRNQVFIEEESVTGADGERRWFATAKVPLVEPDGSCNRVLGVATDITERRQLQEDLETALRSAEEAKMAAEKANAAKDDFLAILSHELRTPLTPVVAGLALMERKHPELSQELSILSRNAGLEARLIDDLLDLTRIARGKFSLDRRLMDLRMVVERVAETCRTEMDSRRIHYLVDIEESPHLVNGDASRLQQVLWNLVNNSMKFTPGGGCIGVRLYNEKDQVVLEVSDSGAGIEQQALRKIFNAFEQAGEGTVRKAGGLGLGLAISKRLVEIHDGDITAESAGKGKGSTFRVRLPRSEPMTTGVEEHFAAAKTKPRKILLVEDHSDTAFVMQLLLENCGYEVQITGDVAGALAATAVQSFDLLISDLGLPDGSGLELMRQLRGHGSSMRSIALSGYGREEDVRRSKEAGFNAHLTKPVDADALIRMVETA